MVYTYTPAYYSSFQDSITSICKSILPFSFKKLGLPAAERQLSKLQTDNLKWQQDSFHRILNLMGLHKEGILPESEVSDFKSGLLETLIASKGTECDHPAILRDKLLFLQELLYAKCISDEEYHASKRHLLQRLAVQGAEIEARDVILGGSQKENSDEEWSVIDLREEKCLINKDGSANSKNRPKPSAIKLISNLGFGGSGKNRAEKSSIFDHLGPNGTPKRNQIEQNTPKDDQNPPRRSILMSETSVLESDKVKKKKKQWGGGFIKWNRGISEEEPLNTNLVENPIGEGPDTKRIKKKLHSDGSASDFFIDKVLGDNIKKELTRIQTELSSTNANLHFSNDEMETISTKLPVDKDDLQKFFPKSWCDRHGDVVLDVVKKEFKGHVHEMESARHSARDLRKKSNPSRWATFDDDENSHPNVYSHSRSSNPFLDEDDSVIAPKKLINQSFSNPFWEH